nr:hypothetical protein CFP56_27690 [Quercus suber]
MIYKLLSGNSFTVFSHLASSSLTSTKAKLPLDKPLRHKPPKPKILANQNLLGATTLKQTQRSLPCLHHSFEKN